MIARDIASTPAQLARLPVRARIAVAATSNEHKISRFVSWNSAPAERSSHQAASSQRLRSAVGASRTALPAMTMPVKMSGIRKLT